MQKTIGLMRSCYIVSTPDFKDIEAPEPEKISSGNAAKSGIGKILGFIGGLMLTVVVLVLFGGWSGPIWATAGFAIVGVLLLFAKYKLEN